MKKKQDKASVTKRMNDDVRAAEQRGDLDDAGEIEVRDNTDLTHEERVRGMALAQACKYYTDTIVKDGALYTAMISTGKVLKPATYIGVLEVAYAFYAFVSGSLDKDKEELPRLRNTQERDEVDEKLDRAIRDGVQTEGK